MQPLGSTSVHNHHHSSYDSAARRSRSASIDDSSQLPTSAVVNSNHELDGSQPHLASRNELRRRCAHYAGLVLASMLGCLIRLGLDAMGTYDGQIIFELAWAQGVGCGIMGLALYRKDDLNELYPPLYTFITTGIAGSVTSFSAWMLGGYQAFGNLLEYQRGGFYDAVDGIAYTFATMAIAMGCLSWGEHVSRCLPSMRSVQTFLQHPSTPTQPEKLPSSLPGARDIPDPSTATVRGSARSPDLRLQLGATMDYLFLSSAVLSYLIALLVYCLGPASWRHKATLPILLSPPGAMLRYYLATLNTKAPFANRFPIGTFIANIVGTLIMGGVFAAEYLPSSQGGAAQCNALWAIQQGFCGCLTTVSTFVVEARSIKGKRWTWLYVGISVVLGHVCILVTFGTARWAGRLGEKICSA